MALPEAQSHEWIRISVKYSNICEVCKSEILQGEQALWARGSKRIKHVSCGDNNSLAQATPAFGANEIHPTSVSPSITTDNTNGTNSLISRYCKNCGFNLATIGPAKFCPNCGGNLEGLDRVTSQNAATISKGDLGVSGISSSHASPSSSPPLEELDGFDCNDGQIGEGKNQSNNQAPLVSIEELGRRLEDMTAQILASMGYSTEKRQILQGKSKSRNEIDILAKKGGKVLAVECKNYSRYVGADQLREFKSKLEDLQIENALFVTNAVFSKDAELFADHHHIRLWNGRILRENFFSMTIGRLGAVQETVFRIALPVNVSFEQVSGLHLANPSAIRLQRPRLIFHPYYKFDYHLSSTRIDPGRGVHTVRDAGTIIVDALDGEILSSQGKASRLFSRFASNSDLSEADDTMTSREEHQVIHDILNIKVEYNYGITQPKEFDITKLEYGVPYKSARYSVISKVIEDNTKDVTYNLRISKNNIQRRRMTIVPKPSEVFIKRISIIHVPMWSLDMEGNNGVIYSRRILAASGVTLVDTIAHCPKHFTLGKLQFIKRQTHAVCEICGGAFCKDHVSQVNGVFYCQQHIPDEAHSTESEKNHRGKLGLLKKGLTGF